MIRRIVAFSLRWSSRVLTAFLAAIALAVVASYAIPAGRIPTGQFEVSFGTNNYTNLTLTQDNVGLLSIISSDLDGLRPNNWKIQWAGLDFSFGTPYRSQNSETSQFFATHVVSARIPNWMILVVAAPWPMWTCWRFIRRRRARLPNGCPHCNYDMTGNQSGTCPECGEPLKIVSEDDRER